MEFDGAMNHSFKGVRSLHRGDSRQQIRFSTAFLKNPFILLYHKLKMLKF